MSSQEDLKEKQNRQKHATEIKRAASEWLSYNKKVLDAQVNFLKAIKNKRNNIASDNTKKIKETFIKNISEFLKA